jgi:hypothetical protein
MEVRYKALKIKIDLRRMSWVLFLILIKSPIWAQEKMKVDDVNPLSDTSILSFSEGKDGVGTPFSMTHFVPQIRENKIISLA